MAQNPIVTITMENGGVIKAELYPEIAPTSVNNFLSLINKHFYDGLIFKEIAEHTNMSINTTLGRVRYALINLRKIMDENNIMLTRQ